MILELLFLSVVAGSSYAVSLWKYMRNHLDSTTMVIWGTFVAHVLGYLLGCLPYVVLDYLRLPFFEKYKVQKSKYPTGKEQWKTLAMVMLLFVAVVLPLIAFGEKFFILCGVSIEEPLPSRTTILVQVFLFFLIEDYMNYWIHRWLHSPLMYRYVHSVHHEYTAPFALAASYAHPVEVVLLGIPTFTGPLLVGPHLLTLWIWTLARSYEAIDIHSGYEFPWSINNYLGWYAGTEHHDYHHYMHSGNFASIFVWCDRMYNTNLGYEAFMRKKSAVS